MGDSSALFRVWWSASLSRDAHHLSVERAQHHERIEAGWTDWSRRSVHLDDYFESLIPISNRSQCEANSGDVGEGELHRLDAAFD